MKIKLAALCLLFLFLSSMSASALPQYSVESARSCANCHVKPAGWENPAVALRKCTLDCAGCHVNPTGAGMRKASGTFYGKQILPMFGKRPTEKESYSFSGVVPNPMEGDRDTAPAPMTIERYAGINPFPTFQIGTDVRSMVYMPENENEDDSFFPMQIDLYLAVRPYNPRITNEGRLTLLINTGFEGNRKKEYDDILDRWLIREWYALYDDLPSQFYVKAGRFMPAYGWRLDDHTAFIRQSQTFTPTRQVTGIEMGINPNYPYVNVSVFNSSRDWEEPFRSEDGQGFSLNAGYRTFLWQAGASFLYETSDVLDQYWAGVQWGLNLMKASHPWKKALWLPVTYLGEFDIRNRSFADGRVDQITGYTTFHQVSVLLLTGLQFIARYDWQDPDSDTKDDERSRYTLGVEIAPYTNVSMLVHYRMNEEAITFDNNELIAQLHFWY